jgi:hypothetical protein
MHAKMLVLAHKGTASVSGERTEFWVLRAVPDRSTFSKNRRGR